MKRFTLLVLTVLFVNQIYGQITLSQRFDLSSDEIWNSKTVYLENSGYKIMIHDSKNRTIKLYNLDNTVFKTMSYPKYPQKEGWEADVFFVSENLFDLDSDIEFIISNFDDIDYDSSWFYIINEDGSVLESFEKHVLGGGMEYELSVFNTNDETKLAAIDYSDTSFVLYNLPGKLACIPCAVSDSTTHLKSIKINSYSMDLYPNPAYSIVNIKTNLPLNTDKGIIKIFNQNGREVKSVRVNGGVQVYNLNIEDLESGFYIYRLYTDKGIEMVKKGIVIK